MSAIYVTVPGRVATTPELLTSDKIRGAKFRVASTERWFNRSAEAWNDAEPVYLTVTCWRQLAENVLTSIRVGDPVLVHGKLVMSRFERDGRVESRLEVAASAVGPDLRWSTAAVTRTRSAAADTPQLAGGEASPGAESGHREAAAGEGDGRVPVLAGEGAVGA